MFLPLGGFIAAVIMIKIAILVLIVAITNSEAATTFSKPKSLQMVIVLFRHGDRSPINTYPTDPHKDHPWIGGYLSLQPRGIRNMYELGQILGERYGSLIPEHGMYTSNITYVSSSASERCVLSAQSLLAGFFKPNKDVLDMPIPWQPVPVHVLTPSEDTILGQRRKCPKLDAVREDLFKNPIPEFKQWVKEATNLQDYISQQIKSPLTNFRQVMTVCDALEVGRHYGLELPSWAKEIYPEKVEAFVRGYLQTFSATPELQRIRGGAILAEFLTRLNDKQNGVTGRTLLFYSAHEVTQINLFRTMDIKPLWNSRPEYGATTVFELHDLPAENDMEVRMFYFPNTKTTSPTQIEIPNCESPCSLTRFDAIISPLLLHDYDIACSLD